MSSPEVPEPVGNYNAFVRAGNHGFISGQLPLANGALVWRGQIGAELTPERGYGAARTRSQNVLAQLKRTPGSFDKLGVIVGVET